MNTMRRLFPSQLDDERIYLVVREHWVLLFGKLLIWLAFAAVLLAFEHYGPIYLPGYFDGQTGSIVRLFFQVYTIFLALSLFIIWLLYYLNIQVITNVRVVDIDQTGLFSHVVSELHIEKIEDVTSETRGIFGTLFNFGNVYIQTAGTKERFVFDNVPQPAVIEKTILDLYEKLPDKKEG